jgi:hypothetical protein
MILVESKFTHITFFAFFALLCALCVRNSSHNERAVPQLEISKDSTHPKKIVPDDYPVTDDMFGTYITQNGLEMKSGDIVSLDKVWFRNDSLQEVLVFELYTDYYRNIIFDFRMSDVPKELIKIMELNDAEGDTVDQKSKERFFSGFIKSASQTNRRYFRSKKGFRLGDSKTKALTIYGKPDNISKTGNVEKYEWDFIGDVFYDPKKDVGKKIAISSYGHQTILFFRNNKLIALILHNDIP